MGVSGLLFSALPLFTVSLLLLSLWVSVVCQLCTQGFSSSSTVQGREVTAEYLASVTVRSYSNPTGRCAACGGATPALPGCCDVPDPVPLDQSCPTTDTCDTTLFYCVRAVGSAGLCQNDEIIITQIVFLNSRESFFGSTVFGSINPLTTSNNGSWQVSYYNIMLNCCFITCITGRSSIPSQFF